MNYYRNKKTGETVESLKTLSGDWEKILVAPNQKFMVAANKATGKSKLKDSEKVLKARARNHSRDYELDDNIRFNRDNGLDAQVKAEFLNSKGERRKKVDDI